MTFTELIQTNFQIRDGKFCEYTGSVTPYYVREELWSKEHYRVFGGLYSEHADEYSIKTEQWSNFWYLYHGYTQICRLNYHGGQNWTKY